ncbi:unnamed protein product [Cylicocyclus nassatus]|uniref:Uncharacterized protein n=1 Tax=Cylicocyclus nassatus TaxID=53992 RepID=A0AA36MDY7_CYLNA|nr:unnamed protein product [Cylicocyclus nassatus]
MVVVEIETDTAGRWLSQMRYQCTARDFSRIVLNRIFQLFKNSPTNRNAWAKSFTEWQQILKERTLKRVRAHCLEELIIPDNHLIEKQ